MNRDECDYDQFFLQHSTSNAVFYKNNSLMIPTLVTPIIETCLIATTVPVCIINEDEIKEIAAGLHRSVMPGVRVIYILSSEDTVVHRITESNFMITQ